MAANIEIKAKIEDFAGVKAIAQKLSDQPGRLIQQEDIFFRTGTGRLKLRILAPDWGELIYYEREDAAGPRQSTYYISTTTDPAALKMVLSIPLGVRGIVRKERWLYLVENTRIHLDQVEGLGSFLELEVVLGPDQTTKQGEAIALNLMAKFGIKETDLIEVAYIDLLEGHDL